MFAEADSTGAITRLYSYYPGTDRPYNVREGGSEYVFLTDPQGNVIGLIDNSGAFRNQYSYTAFGELTASTEAVPNDLRFAGQQYDSETGLYYMRASYYDPMVGRFISQDPIGLNGGINPYVYANNDPINGRDPSGLSADPLCGDGYSYVESMTNPENGDISIYCQEDGGGDDISDPGFKILTIRGAIAQPPGTVSTPEDGFPGDGFPLDNIVPDPLGLSLPSDGPTNGAVYGGDGAGANSGSSKVGFFSCTFTGGVGMAVAAFVLDGVGAIPGGGNILHGIQFGAGIVSTGISIFGDVRGAAYSVGGLSLALDDKAGIALEVHGFEVIPIAGNVVSGMAAFHDYCGSDGVKAQYKRCMSGTN